MATALGVQVPRCTTNRELSEHECVQQILQAEINVYKQQIIEKTRLMNSFAPINRLPPELLAEILLHWADAIKGPSLTLHRTWVQVAHICHHWREIALASPRLWSEFALGSLDWTKAMLARSKRAPLKISTFSYHNTQQTEALKLILQELPRIESLELRGIEYLDIGSRINLSPNAPLLRSLVVHAGARSSHYATGTHRPIVVSLEKVDMPRLADLELRENYVPWSSPLFKPLLTRLVLHGTSTLYHGADFAEVLRVLEGMPLLQNLELSGVLPSLPSDDAPLPDLDHYVSLPALRTLSILGMAKSCAFILQHLNFSEASLQVECRSTQTSADVKILAPIIAAKLRGSGSDSPMTPLRSLNIARSSLSAWDDIHPLETLITQSLYDMTGPKPRLRLTFSSVALESIRDVLVVLPLEEVQACVIDGPAVSVASQGWQKLLESMPNLRELGACETPLALAEVLGQRFPAAVEQPKGRKGKAKPKTDVLLPKLKVLLLSCVRFRNYLDDMDDDSPFAVYKNMLETRKKARRQIKTLIIRSGINFSEEDCGELKGLVKEVKWDGIEDFSEGEDEDEEDYSDEGGFFGLPMYYDDDFDYPW